MTYPIPGYGIPVQTTTGTTTPANPYGTPAPAPTYATPGYPAPGYGTPAPAPTYAPTPGYPAPGYGTPAPAPTYAPTPGYPAPPAYGTPAPAPTYAAPGYPAPGYGTPAAQPAVTPGQADAFGVANYGTIHQPVVQSPATTLMTLISSLGGALKNNQIALLEGGIAMSDAQASSLTMYMFEHLCLKKTDMIVLKKAYQSKRSGRQATFALQMTVGRDDRLNANLPLLQRYGVTYEATTSRILNTIVSLCVSGMGTNFQDVASVIDKYCSMFITIEYHLGEIYNVIAESGGINDPQVQELFQRGALYVEWGGMTITPYLSKTATGGSQVTFMYGLSGQLSKTTVKNDLGR